MTDIVERLRKALRFWGQHANSCASNVYLTSNPPKRQPCDCGLAKALSHSAGEST